MNLLHDVPLGKNAPDEINVIIEIPHGSHNKYEVDKETGLIKLDRANYNASAYPFDYGFAPRTYWEDNDPLDVIVLSTYPLHPGILVAVRPIAMMEMTDTGESDNKIIAVPVEDRRWEDVQDLRDINKHALREWQHFFETVKQLKKKPAVVTVHGFKGRDDAKKTISRSIELYRQKFGE